MKHAVLINNASIENLSVRSIGSYLKGKGFCVTTIHIVGRKDGVFKLLPHESLELLAEYCMACDLVGIALMTTHHLNRAIQINNYLRQRIKAKIIWGGVPIICDPMYYAQFADYLCIGEGETVMAGLLEGQNLAEIEGLGYRIDEGNFILNPLPDLIDINETPIPRLEVADAYVLKNRQLIPLKNDLKRLVRYSILSIRGCPYSCSYCLNSRLKKVFKSKGAYIRFVDISRVIEELKWAKKNLPGLKEIIFDDDDFFLRSNQELEQLLTAYSEHIDLPIFFIQSNILHISELKIDLLKKTGIQLRYLHIGYQTGSERTNRSVYYRYFNREIFIKKLKMLASKGIRVKLHVISDNPYEAFSDKYASLSFCHDLIKAVKPVSTIRQPIEIYDHKLMFYPGSSLFSKAKADQVISGNYINDVLLKRNTLRTYKEDIDNDAFVVDLFNFAMGTHRLSSLSLIVFWLLKVRPLYYVLIRFNVLKACNAIARL